MYVGLLDLISPRICFGDLGQNQVGNSVTVLSTPFPYKHSLNKLCVNLPVFQQRPYKDLSYMLEN